MVYKVSGIASYLCNRLQGSFGDVYNYETAFRLKSLFARIIAGESENHFGLSMLAGKRCDVVAFPLNPIHSEKNHDVHSGMQRCRSASLHSPEHEKTLAAVCPTAIARQV